MWKLCRIFLMYTLILNVNFICTECVLLSPNEHSYVTCSYETSVSN